MKLDKTEKLYIARTLTSELLAIAINNIETHIDNIQELDLLDQESREEVIELTYDIFNKIHY